MSVDRSVDRSLADAPAALPVDASGPADEPDPLEQFRIERDRRRREMGGAHKVAAAHADGQLTVRDRIDLLLDDGSFVEIGTFSHSERPGDEAATPGDGKIGGHGTIDGRPVSVAGDDATVKRGTSSIVGSRKLDRVYRQAIAAGNPFVYFGETGGARIPDTMGSTGFTKLAAFPEFGRRPRSIPVASAIVGESFGGSSFLSALSDFVVQVRGSCLAVTSPRVVAIATGESITNDELGGVDVHARTTGQIDLGADDEAGAAAAIRRFLSFLPSSAHERPPHDDRGAGRLDDDPAVPDLVPRRRRRAYDMRRLLDLVLDDGLFEIRPLVGRGLLTGFARLDGHAVGVIASQPMVYAGALDPLACQKATRILRICDTFALPVVFVQDTPGFLVGRQVEHGRLLHSAMQLHQALVTSVCPKLTIVVRKAYGLAHQVLGGALMGSDLLAAWPTAEIGFMDPDVGANVVHARAIEAAAPEERAELRARLADEIGHDAAPYGAAGVMTIDEVIDPASTRRFLATRLERLAGRPVPPPEARPLASWPTC